MFITRMSLSRRTMLRGLGATIALPFLDAMVPASTGIARTAASAQTRVGFVYVPNGLILEQWASFDDGDHPAFGPILKPLESFRDRSVVVSRLTRPGHDSDHALASAGWLSGATPVETEGQDFRAGTTIDQIIAREIGGDTPFPSLELATEDFTGYVGGCSPGYACAYVNTLSWATPTTPLPMEINPRTLFERLFGRPGTPAQRLARMRTNRSILDSITTDLARLNRLLGSRDRARLGEYLDHVREIERRLERMEATQATEVELTAPIGVPPSFKEHVELLFDLLLVAYQSDLTRVFTFMMAREFSMKAYPEIGVSEPHHSVSHHQNNAAQIAKHAAINIHHAELFADFLRKLDALPDGDGSVLEHSLIFYGAGMSNGNIHSAYPLPLLAVGGSLRKRPRHLEAPPESPIGNLWVGLANQFGSRIDALGDSTGRLEL